MKLTCLGSSSNGNCYLLTASDGETLIIECGVPARAILKTLAWDLSNVTGCFVSHRHDDHSRSVADLVRRGVRVFALPDVLQSHRVADNHFSRPIAPKKGYRVGGFKVFAIPLSHDVPCLGFVIDHPEMGKTLFATDTMMLAFRIPGLNHIMVECNYSDAILERNIANGDDVAVMRDRLMKTHMELRTTETFLRTNDLSAVNEIVLLHLSGDNSDADSFRDHIRRATGKPVYIADNGFETDLSKDNY